MTLVVLLMVAASDSVATVVEGICIMLLFSNKGKKSNFELNLK